MSKRLVVICLEDDALDAELIRAEIVAAVGTFEWCHVTTAGQYEEALFALTPGLIISDYNIPGYDGMSALARARELRPLAPFIFVSGALGEEIAIETLKSGATDFVLKNRLKRLGPAVQRALAAAYERSERRRAERELEAHRNLLDALINAIPDTIYAVNRAGRTLLANRSLLEIIRRSPEDVEGQPLQEMLGQPAGGPERESEDARLMRTGEEVINEQRLARVPAGDWRWFSTTKTLLRNSASNEVVGLVSISRDVTSTRLLEQALSDISNREQRRIGSDLHDGLGQELTGLSLMLKGIETAAARDSSELALQIKRAREVLTRAIESTRALARGLAPVDLERGGLTAALEHLAAQCTELYGLRCEYRGGVKLDTELEEAPATHLYRIAQEAIANAVKHGKAGAIVISLTRNPGGLLLEIQDDGHGIRGSVASSNGMGLKLMEYRARIIGGELNLGRSALGGTAVSCFCPLVPAAKSSVPRGQRL